MSGSALPNSGDSRGIKEVHAAGHTVPVATYKFGNFILDRQRACLFRDGEGIKLRPKSFELLAYLVENHGRLITKDELMKAGWPDSFVTDDSLVQCIKEMRRALEDDSQHLIKTLPRRGYIFEADVVKNGAGTENARISSEIINGEEPLPVEAADAPSVVTGSPKRSTVRRFAPWVGLTLLTVAAISVILALYPSANTSPPVWRAVPLTTDPGVEVNPALSPDNSRVAFTWNGEKQDNFDIYVQPIGPGRPQRLTTDPAQDTSPAWSPQGDKIAFLRRINGDGNHLVLIPAFGGPEQIVAETRSRVVFGTFGSDLRKNLAWTPDGHWIVAQHRETEESLDGLYLFSVSTGEKRLMIQSPMGYFDENPAFSPSGDAIAFARHVSKNASELHVVALSKDLTPSGSARRLTSEGGSASHPVWTKDGSRIIYRLGSELRVVDSRNSDASERIPLEAGNIIDLSLERDLVYSQALSDTNIYRAEIPSPNGPLAVPHLLISSTREDSQPRYSPIGKAIAFRSARSGAGEIWISNADGSNPVQVTSFGPPFFPNWSPDGKRLLFHARPDGHGDIFSVAASGGPPKRLTSDPSDEILASYSHDGHWIYFSSSRSGQLEVWKMPADGGDATRLTIGGGTMPVESPDGKTVFYARSKGTASTIWKIPVAGGEAVQVTGPLAKDPAFAVSINGIYYATPPESPTRQLIQFLDFATNQSRPVVVAEREIGMGMSLSPDGRFLIFAQRDQVGRDLMLIRDFGVRN